MVIQAGAELNKKFGWMKALDENSEIVAHYGVSPEKGFIVAIPPGSRTADDVETQSRMVCMFVNRKAYPLMTDDMKKLLVNAVEWAADLFIPAAVEDRGDMTQPGEFALMQNYPNPFNPTTSISYTLNKTSEVKLTVFDQLGRQIITLVNTRNQAGQYNVEWNGTDSAGHAVPSGIYFYKLETNSNVQTKKMMLLK